MAEIWRSISDATTNAYENCKEQLHDHPLLDTAIVVGLTVAGGIAFKGRLAGIWPSSKALLGEGEAVDKTFSSVPAREFNEHILPDIKRHLTKHSIDD
jgi:hypothetical protein